MMFGSSERGTNLLVRASDSPENMRIVDRPININAMARKIDVDSRIPLRYYYRIADNLLKQASIYREERNIVDLYVMLLRFSSLVSETIPYHRDYNAMFPKERILYKKKLGNVIGELESLKPDVQRSVTEMNRARMRAQRGSPERISYNSASSSFESPPFNQKQISSNLYAKELYPASRSTSQSSLARGNEYNQIVQSNNVKIERQLQKLSFSVPPPKEETLSRHSILGPNGLRGHWLGPSTAIKVHYPSNADLTPIENPRLLQGEQNDVVTAKDGDPGGDKSAMELVLDLDDGRWSSSAEELCSDDNKRKELVEVNNIRQPSPPPVLAQVNQDYAPICPSKVADPRPGPANSSQDDSFTSYQHLHIPISMLEGFLRLAKTNTTKNLETCGVLAGSLKNRIFHITTLIIPKQESTSDSCQTTNEEEIFDVQDKLSLLPLGWIHTHPSQTCFMSSVDLHTHYSYQIMLPEAIAIVMAPTDKTRPHGIFHLSDPGGVSVIRKCQQRGFHPHEEPADGSPIYEHCSHVFMNPNLKFEVIDLR